MLIKLKIFMKEWNIDCGFEGIIKWVLGNNKGKGKVIFCRKYLVKDY